MVQGEQEPPEPAVRSRDVGPQRKPVTLHGFDRVEGLTTQRHDHDGIHVVDSGAEMDGAEAPLPRPDRVPATGRGREAHHSVRDVDAAGVEFQVARQPLVEEPPRGVGSRRAE